MTFSMSQYGPPSIGTCGELPESETLRCPFRFQKELDRDMPKIKQVCLARCPLFGACTQRGQLAPCDPSGSYAFRRLGVSKLEVSLLVSLQESHTRHRRHGRPYGS